MEIILLCKQSWFGFVTSLFPCSLRVLCSRGLRGLHGAQLQGLCHSGAGEEVATSSAEAPLAGRQPATQLQMCGEHRLHLMSFLLVSSRTLECPS